MPRQGENQSADRIADQRAVLQSTNRAALARGQRGCTTLNRPGIPPSNDLKTPATQERQHQPQATLRPRLSSQGAPAPSATAATVAGP